METQVGLKTTALTLFLNLLFHFLPAAALCDDFSFVNSVETDKVDSTNRCEALKEVMSLNYV